MSLGVARAMAMAVALCVGYSATAAVAQTPAPLTGALANASYPDRALVLSAPGGATVTPTTVHVAENGQPAHVESVTRLSQAAPGDSGLVLVIDQSPSMRGRPLAQAMAAARAVAQQRGPGQELGVITFAQDPRVILPLTADAHTIASALATLPPVRAGTQILPAVASALGVLADSHVTAGAVVLLSDGDDWERSPTASVPAVVSLARSSGTPIMAVGLRDSSYHPGELQALAAGSGGTFVSAAAGDLPRVFAGLATQLSQRYLVRYRSVATPGQSVSLRATVSGIGGTVALQYRASTWTSSPSFAMAARNTAMHGVTASITHGGTSSGAQSDTAQGGQSFWSSPRGVALVAILAGCLIGLAVALGLARGTGSRPARARVRAFVSAPDEDVPAPAADTPVRLHRLLATRRWWPGFVEDVDVARLPGQPDAYIVRGVILAGGAGVVASFLVGNPLPALVLLVSPWLGRGWVGRLARRQRARFADGLPADLQDLASAMRSGRSIAAALSAVAEGAGEPLASEFERIVADEQLGRPLEEALLAAAKRMRSGDMEQVALIASLHRRSGSHVAEALERVAESARERADISRELKALTAQAKLSSWVLTALPVFLLVGLELIAPQYERPMFHTTFGLLLLGLAALLILAGWRVMSHIIEVEG